MKNLILIITFTLLSSDAKAATYNFYFNNTEQGANSNANPTVTVQDGKVVTNGTASATSTETNTATTSSPSTMNSSAATGGNVVDPLPEFPRAKFKFFMGMATGKRANDTPNGQNYASHKKFSGGAFYYPKEHFGFGLIFGRFAGMEMEFNPIGVPTGFGRVQAGLTMGLLKDQIGNERNRRWSSSETQKPLNIYFGAQTGINLLRDLSLNLAYRIAPIEISNRTVSSWQWTANYLF
jgi:hypothetical protein